MAVAVIVDLAGPVAVDVHLNGTATLIVGVIGPVIGAACKVAGADHGQGHGGGAVQVHGHDQGGGHDHDYGYGHVDGVDGEPQWDARSGYAAGVLAI